MIWYLAIGLLAGLVIGVAIGRNPAVRKSKRVYRVPSEADTGEIMKLFDSRDKIANDDIEKLLKISDATATRYLNRLVGRGLIKQRGKGRGVHYLKNN